LAGILFRDQNKKL